MTITADSGSTKTTWLFTEAKSSWTIHTQGLNPFHQSYEFMCDVIDHELLENADFPKSRISDISEIHFYGAGCTKDKSPILKTILQKAFPLTSVIEVDSDMLGAAKALFGNKEGIACILGTGANSCLFDGKKIVANVSPMGYILGDEGSGAVLGKTFVNLLYKGVHDEDIPDFEHETGLTQVDIIQKVYREPMPNRFLASLCYYIFKHKNTPWIHDMVVECFRLFFLRNVQHYNRPDLTCSFIGSVAFYLPEELKEAANIEGFKIGKIQKEPLVTKE